MSLREPDSTCGPVRERDTPRLTFVVKDNAGAAIPGSALDTMTLTLYSEKPPYTIINSRDRLDVKANVDVSGNFLFEFEKEDMAIVDNQLTEKHRLLLEWEWDNDKRGSWEIRIIVSNELKVPV